MKKLRMALALLIACSLQAWSSTTIKVYITTGTDDLRNGNHAYISFGYSNGEKSPEYDLGGGFGQNTINNKTIEIERDIMPEDVSSVTIRHDGSPRPGYPFDTYDPWDLQVLKVAIVGTKSFSENILCHQSGNPLFRFMPSARTQTIKTNPQTKASKAISSNTIKVYIATGADDLRNGNNAFITINYTDGSNSPEYALGGGFAQNSFTNKTLVIDRNITTIADIAAISIRHDGSPRPGNPFDTYDPWDLQLLRCVVVGSDGTESNIVNHRGNPLYRFTGSNRTHQVNRQ